MMSIANVATRKAAEAHVRAADMGRRMGHFNPRWNHDAALGHGLGLDTVHGGVRHRAGRGPRRLSDANAMTGDVVVLVTAVGVLLLALLGAALVSWWVWQGGRDT